MPPHLHHLARGVIFGKQLADADVADPELEERKMENDPLSVGDDLHAGNAILDGKFRRLRDISGNDHSGPPLEGMPTRSRLSPSVETMPPARERDNPVTSLTPASPSILAARLYEAHCRRIIALPRPEFFTADSGGRCEGQPANFVNAMPGRGLGTYVAKAGNTTSSRLSRAADPRAGEPALSAVVNPLSLGGGQGGAGRADDSIALAHPRTIHRTMPARKMTWAEAFAIPRRCVPAVVSGGVK